MHSYWQNVGKDNYKFVVLIFQLSYGPWLMSEFYFHLISWEQIDGFWWIFVYAVLWLRHEIFPNFSTELWPLIDVKMSFFFLSIFRNNEWFFYKILFMQIHSERLLLPSTFQIAFFFFFFFFCLNAIVSKCIKSKIMCMVIDFSLAIFWNSCDALTQFWEEISKNTIVWEKTSLKRNFHAGFSANMNSVVYQTKNTKKVEIS